MVIQSQSKRGFFRGEVKIVHVMNNLILQIGKAIYSKTFQKIHCIGKNSFTRKRKLP
jgi:hypothetical protein